METKHIIIAVAVLAVAVAVYLLFDRQTSGTSIVDPSSIQPGPIQHERLDDALIARIRAFEPVLADIYPMSHEKWLEGFQRDLNPESEIAIWESIAAAWQRLPSLGTLTPDERKEAFGVLLVRSGSDNVESTLAGLKHLSRSRAETLLGFYTAPPKPVTIAPAPR
jgi:hypothetical protein